MERGVRMKLRRHYLELHHKLAKTDESEHLAVLLEELAAALDCTQRNMNLLLKRMVDHGWIVWEPRRGRGNRSRLRFLVSREEIALQMAQMLVERHDLRGAIAQLEESGVSETGKAQFNSWLYSNFGHQSELRDDKKIDTLRFPYGQPIYTLDPAFSDYANEAHLISQLFDGLVRINGSTQTIVPHLAHAWEVDERGCEWTFYLRKGVLFHHGKEMTAEDVAFTLNRVRNVETRSLYRWAYELIEQVNVVDPTTVQVRLMQRNELFLPFLATSRAFIVPADAYADHGQRHQRHPIGTGPFKFVRNSGQVCELEAFPYYFQGRAHLDKVEIWSIPDLYERESLDLFQMMHNVRLPEHHNETWNEVKQQGTTCKFVTLNLSKKGPLASKQARQAVCEAIDCNKIIQALAGDVIVPSSGFVRAATGAVTGAARQQSALPLQAGGDQATERKTALDDHQASSLNHEDTSLYPWTDPLDHADASLPGAIIEQPLELCTIEQYEADARLVAQVCEEAGIRVNITLLPLEQFKGSRRLQADMLLFAVMLDNDAELRLYDLYLSFRDRLYPAMKSRVDSLLQQLTREQSPQRRWELLGQLELLLVEQHAIVFLYQKHLKTAFHPSINGIALDSLNWVQFKDIWIKSI
ncbi:ABC transporter substrate-binding protein [Paenibacillaceae bacterium]|nr:ABC transporter substrate-binding protein [Paenibacillaceae bacterium]